MSALPPKFPNISGETCNHGMWHPTERILEFVHITHALVLRITEQKNHVAIFPNITDTKTGTPVTKPTSVLLPFEPTYVPANGIDRLNNPLNAWPKVKAVLLKLKEICESGEEISNVGSLIRDAIKVYCPQVDPYSNFDIISSSEIGELIIKCIPKIISLAIQLPNLISKEIPILKSGESRTIYATRKLCACLLANAFFCTFPVPGDIQKTPEFNFFTLFQPDPRYPSAPIVKKEKLKCILNYFEIISKDATGYNQIISFERRCISTNTAWERCPVTLTSVAVDTQGKIEDCREMLQVDFANKIIGGGVYRESCVMEDIRFCISPELLVARLFSQTLNDDEVLVVTGTEIFSQYTGFAESFRYKETINVNFSQLTDTMGRTLTQVVAMDAHLFKGYNKQQQYETKYVDRELHKCYVAFIHGPNFISPVATGNWGCGLLNGDKELKFLIQWMASSLQNRPKLKYHTMNDIQFSNAIEDVTDHLRHRNVSVAELYKTLRQFNWNGTGRGSSGLFKFVKSKLD